MVPDLCYGDLDPFMVFPSWQHLNQVDDVMVVIGGYDIFKFTS